MISTDELEEAVERTKEIEAKERDVLRGQEQGRTTLELPGLDSSRGGAP